MLAVARPPSTSFVSGPTPKRSIVRHLASSASSGVPWREPPPGALSLRKLQGQLTLEGLDLRCPTSRTTLRSSLSSLFQNLASIAPSQDGLPALPASPAHTVLKIVRSLAWSKSNTSWPESPVGGQSSQAHQQVGMPSFDVSILRRSLPRRLRNSSSLARGFTVVRVSSRS